MSDRLVTVENASFGYGRKVVLDGVNLQLCRGEFWGFVGPNGSGKTTLLLALLGLLAPKAGQLVWHHPARIGYVPQREALDALLPLTALDIVLMGQLRRGGFFHRFTSEDKDKAISVMELIGIANLALRPYRELSGGQKQRVLIARALAAEPEMLLLDEPTNGLDLPTEYAIMQLLQQIHEEKGVTIVFVTHLLNLVANTVTHLALFYEGRVVAGSVEEMLSQQQLSATYQIPILVRELNGYRLVMVQEPTKASTEPTR